MINFLRSLFARKEDKGLVGYRCPKCDHFFLIPSEIVQDFSRSRVKSITKEEKVILIAPVVMS